MPTDTDALSAGEDAAARAAGIAASAQASSIASSASRAQAASEPSASGFLSYLFSGDGLIQDAENDLNRAIQNAKDAVTPSAVGAVTGAANTLNDVLGVLKWVGIGFLIFVGIAALLFLLSSLFGIGLAWKIFSGLLPGLSKALGNARFVVNV